MVSKTDLVGLGTPVQLANRAGYEPETATAAGSSSSANATVLHATANFVKLTTAGGADSVRLSSSLPLGQFCVLYNLGSTTAQIYPPTGGNFNGGSTDAAVTIVQNKGRLFIRYNTTDVLSWLTG